MAVSDNATEKLQKVLAAKEDACKKYETSDFVVIDEVKSTVNLTNYFSEDNIIPWMYRPKFDENELGKLSQKELEDLCTKMNAYIDGVLKSAASARIETSYKQKILLRQIAIKDREIQEYKQELSELKAAHRSFVPSLENTLVDPATNIIVHKLRKELASTKKTLQDAKDELNAWKFTPDSNTGKRIMSKCRLLHQENEELGKLVSSGRIAILEGEIALQKSYFEEVKKSQQDLDDLLQDLDEDLEGMQGTIYSLHKELNITAKTKDFTSRRLKKIKGVVMKLKQQRRKNSVQRHRLKHSMDNIKSRLRASKKENLSLQKCKRSVTTEKYKSATCDNNDETENVHSINVTDSKEPPVKIYKADSSSQNTEDNGESTTADNTAMDLSVSSSNT